MGLTTCQGVRELLAELGSGEVLLQGSAWESWS